MSLGNGWGIAEFRKMLFCKASPIMVGLAQLARAPDCGSGGQGFNSLNSPHIGVSPSGKAWDSDSHIPRFES